ncbi:50S ribosomal protein L22 [candidate division Kazan bacterium RIFCSPHIGHO2_01_FULL_49_10]|uniref:Large ribosomal subunit protein uL22 n=1 Tax=candidate division Kazan bacterium RIFCSPLOWO2_01_FULL_48_13 TaxID=1798539 RepID=A0A1F4PPS5_UNCK3|nr:MAG: 50S ribosomal protein L22 [candidate division Kazan bacterium RIFCSPHIGHO2_01_FULL_49_10]OGB85654.1 MAG: 50S ribosomal protein L22 [candidate division Kazan bacterium RIFCSPLOWO2_01_FULL_48_13]
MQVAASTKFVRISPKKVRPHLKDLRGKKVVPVLAALKFANTKSGQLLYKLIHSASANAANNYNLKPDNLKIKILKVDEGPRFRRYWYRSHGSADLQMKRTSHLNVILEEITPTLKPTTVKPKAGSVVKSAPGAALPSTPEKSTSIQSAAPEVKKPRHKGGIKQIFTRTTHK